MRNAPEWILVGKVGRPHGTSGEVLVQSFTDRDDNRFSEGSQLYVLSGSGKVKEKVRVASGRSARKGKLVRFEDYDTRERIHELNGSLLFIPSRELQPPAPGSFYGFQLEGCPVFEGERLVGQVKALVESKANAYLEVDPVGGGELILIPFVSQVVISVDLEESRIRIAEGFLGDSP